jgi:hypothetical protein
MPFPVCMLEYQIQRSFYEEPQAPYFGGSGRLNPVATVLVALSDEIGLTFFPIWKVVVQGTSMWMPSRGAVRVDADSQIDIDNKGFVTAKFRMTSPPDLPESLLQPVAEFTDEIVTIAHFCMLCGCDNVKPVRAFFPSSHLVKRCRERGKVPPDEYYVLDCFIGEHAESAEASGGNHASPRFHVRRGHVRRLPTGRTTWVKQCTVGDASLGRIEKDYRVRVRGASLSEA